MPLFKTNDCEKRNVCMGLEEKNNGSKLSLKISHSILVLCRDRRIFMPLKKKQRSLFLWSLGHGSFSIIARTPYVNVPRALPVCSRHKERVKMKELLLTAATVFSLNYSRRQPVASCSKIFLNLNPNRNQPVKVWIKCFLYS